MLYSASTPDKQETPIAVLFKHLVECPTTCMKDTASACLERGPMWAHQIIHPVPGVLTSSLNPDRSCHISRDLCVNSQGLVQIKQPKPVIHNHIQTIIAFKWNLNMLNFSATFFNTSLHDRQSNFVGIWLQNSYPAKKPLQTEEAQVHAFMKFRVFSKAIFVNLRWKKCKSYEHPSFTLLDITRRFNASKIKKIIQVNKNTLVSIYRNTKEERN